MSPMRKCAEIRSCISSLSAIKGHTGVELKHAFIYLFCCHWASLKGTIKISFYAFNICFPKSSKIRVVERIEVSLNLTLREFWNYLVIDFLAEVWSTVVEPDLQRCN